MYLIKKNDEDKYLGYEEHLMTGKKKQVMLTARQLFNVNTYRNHCAKFKNFLLKKQAENYINKNKLNNCQVIKANL